MSYAPLLSSNNCHRPQTLYNWASRTPCVHGEDANQGPWLVYSLDVPTEGEWWMASNLDSALCWFRRPSHKPGSPILQFPGSQPEINFRTPIHLSSALHRWHDGKVITLKQHTFLKLKWCDLGVSFHLSGLTVWTLKLPSANTSL